MALHYAVGINCKKGQLPNIKAQMSSICAKVCMLMIISVLSDLTLKICSHDMSLLTKLLHKAKFLISEPDYC